MTQLQTDQEIALRGQVARLTSAIDDALDDLIRSGQWTRAPELRAMFLQAGVDRLKAALQAERGQV